MPPAAPRPPTKPRRTGDPVQRPERGAPAANGGKRAPRVLDLGEGAQRRGKAGPSGSNGGRSRGNSGRGSGGGSNGRGGGGIGNGTAGGAGAAGATSYLAIGAFALLYLVAILLWRIPTWPGLLYAGASVVCFIFYAIDKSAARAGRWRTPESTLLLLGLCCGWPGAILAQQWLRHKSSKTSFQLAFWATVAINLVAFGWLAQRFPGA